MKNFIPKFFIYALLFLSFIITAHPRPASASLNTKSLKPIADIVKKEIRAGRIPGAVIVIGNRDKTIFRQAFGYRATRPKKLPMSVNTIFDLASLTKVIATTTAIMQLVEEGKLSIDERVTEYWAEFRSNGKEDITVRDLLTHYSGMRPDLPLNDGWSGYKNAVEMILDEKPLYEHGERFMYSDINFEILGELVRRISDQPLDTYCAEHIFSPLGMKHTLFRPAASLKSTIAPTQYRHGRKGEILCGEVHDPAAGRMGGVAGHAGLFSTADDLSLFSRMLLDGGEINGVRILNSSTVEAMTSPQSPSGKIPLRGLGWAIAAPFASNRDELVPVGSYGHKGYTGTFIWIDPVTRSYVIILTNRVHPDGKGNAEPLRKKIIELVSRASGALSNDQVFAKRSSLKGTHSKEENIEKKVISRNRILTGIDVLEQEDFSPLSGLRIGLITNHTGIDSNGRRSVDILYKAQNVKLAAIFNPEHGLSGKERTKVSSTTDLATGLPVYSLYGKSKRPTEEMLAGIDALVFDIQSAGVRFYTYITTMGYAMEEAAKKGISFYVLDRPNPLNGLTIEGPVMDEELKSFTGYFPLPVRHGMTMGELARLFNKENHIGVDLHVIEMQGYKRSYWFDETGLQWINPSPNLRSLTEATLYPGVALAEGANVSVGRGTETPFEVLGAPWVHANDLARYLNKRNLGGVSFKPVSFTPRTNIFKNRKCQGVRIVLEDRDSLNAALLGVEIINALNRLYPKQFKPDKTLGLVGSHKSLQSIKKGTDPAAIHAKWQDKLNKFRDIRARYLIYPET
jgi:uncharacterized protein YbbC (DUF1343 family)/CubicO group peptidase (beta-lactamase class C family)